MIDTSNKPCPKCSAEVAYNAAKCQKCGFLTTTGKIQMLTGPGMILLLVVLFVIYAIAQGMS